jgi:ribosomal protein S18 acetylase RimI-like enzyme
MRKAASYLVGEHDFKSFCTTRGQAEDTVRTIYRADVVKEHDMITITIKGSGFLYNMVRIIAGTLMKVGMGVYPPEHLAARNRKAAGPTAPARGLTLINMEYETELKKKIIGKNKDWEYQLIQTEISQKGKAYLFINRCREDDFEGLLARVTHQAVRNGARQVYVCDKEDDKRIVPGKDYGYYRFSYGYDMLAMRKKIALSKGDTGEDMSAGQAFQGVWEKVSIWQTTSFCSIYNQVFYAVPNSATLTEKEAREYLVNSRWQLFLIKIRDKDVGFVILVDKEGELEIDSLGVLKEYRGRGLAREILERTEMAAAKMGKESLSLTVASINTAAISLYRKTGFENAGMISRWYVTKDERAET